jgi:hypothetical protein
VRSPERTAQGMESCVLRLSAAWLIDGFAS